MRSRLLFFLTASVYLCSGESMMPSPQALIPRDAITDCQNLTHGLNASCWDSVPPNTGMSIWLNTWNHRTRTCGRRELWANCFMRLAGLPDTHSEPIRCDLIGYDVCPFPTLELFQNLTAPVGYGVASIWGRHSSRGAVIYIRGRADSVRRTAKMDDISLRSAQRR